MRRHRPSASYFLPQLGIAATTTSGNQGQRNDDCMKTHNALCRQRQKLSRAAITVNREGGLNALIGGGSGELLGAAWYKNVI
jgi:hypothetical protein